MSRHLNPAVARIQEITGLKRTQAFELVNGKRRPTIMFMRFMDVIEAMENAGQDWRKMVSPRTGRKIFQEDGE